MDFGFKYPPKLSGFSFDREIILDYRNSNKLLCMRIDLSYKCNLKCKYCYSNELINKNKEALFDDFIDVVDQGTELGLKSIVLLGGEPLLYPKIFDFIKYLYDKNITPVLFTNSLLLNKEVAKKLYDLNTSLIIKYDGNETSQDILSGRNTYHIIRNSLNTLIECGYNKLPENALRLGCASVITRINLGDIVGNWRYFRNNNIFPHIEKMTKTNYNASLSVPPEQLNVLFANLRSIDLNEYRIRWETPCPAIPAHNCTIFFAGCHVNPYLEVSPCPELPPINSLKSTTLKEILKSELFQRIRNIDKNIKGKCSSCRYLIEGPCHGCRSKVFKSTGSLFEADNECTFNP